MNIGICGSCMRSFVMNPLLGALITGGSSLLGGIFSSQTTAQNTQEQIAAQEQMQQQTENFNAQQVQQQEQYQTQMSNTAYQRASQDMKAAGLNPMLAYMQGGASTPSGASASVGTPNVPMPQKTSAMSNLGQAASSAIDSMVRTKMVDKMSDEMALLEAEKAKTEAVTGLVGSQKFFTDTQQAAAANRMPVSRLEGQSAADILGMNSTAREYLNIGSWSGGKAAETISPITDIFNSALGAFKFRLASQAASEASKYRAANFTDKYGVPVDEYNSQ